MFLKCPFLAFSESALLMSFFSPLFLNVFLKLFPPNHFNVPFFWCFRPDPHCCHSLHRAISFLVYWAGAFAISFLLFFDISRPYYFFHHIPDINIWAALPYLSNIPPLLVAITLNFQLTEYPVYEIDWKLFVCVCCSVNTFALTRYFTHRESSFFVIFNKINADN